MNRIYYSQLIETSDCLIAATLFVKNANRITRNSRRDLTAIQKKLIYLFEKADN